MTTEEIKELLKLNDIPPLRKTQLILKIRKGLELEEQERTTLKIIFEANQSDRGSIKKIHLETENCIIYELDEYRDTGKNSSYNFHSFVLVFRLKEKWQAVAHYSTLDEALIGYLEVKYLNFDSSDFQFFIKRMLGMSASGITNL